MTHGESAEDSHVCMCEEVVIRFKAKAPISDTPRHADRQLTANPAEYQRGPRLLGEIEGVTTEERQADEGERSGNRQASSKRR